MIENDDKNVYSDMCEVEILGKGKLNKFFQERLINGKTLKTGIKSEKCQKVILFQLLDLRIFKHWDLVLTCL